MELLSIDRSIVVIIDLQGKLMEMIDRPNLVVKATLRLLRFADIFGVPVILTEQYPRGLGTAHPEIRKGFDQLSVPTRFMEKTSFGCCDDPLFEEQMSELRPSLPIEQRQLVIAGIEAHICVMATVLKLLEQGAQTHLCWECVSGRGKEYRQHALDRMSQAGAIMTNHESVAFEWARHKDHEQFKAMNAILREGQLVE